MKARGSVVDVGGRRKPDRRGPRRFCRLVCGRGAALALSASLGSLLAAVPPGTGGAQLATITIVQADQSSQSGLVGPATLAPASFSKPTKAGDLLVAAVLCGVVSAGMHVPALSLPSGWLLGRHRVGGVQGGLEAAIYFEPNNPGGVTSVPLDADGAVSLPAGSAAYCTTFTWEVAGFGTSASLDASGAHSLVQSENPATMSITVKTSKATTAPDDLVLMAETDGSEVPVSSGLYQVSPPFNLVSQWDDGQVDQPGTFSYALAPTTGVVSGTVSQWSNWIDACAVLVALKS